jgi:hypothetical protein
MLGTLAQHGDRQIHYENWDLALFNLAIDSKLRGCDLAGPLPGFPLLLLSAR